MKIKGNLVILMLVGMLTIGAFTFSACSDNDDLKSAALAGQAPENGNADYNINNYSVSFNGMKSTPFTHNSWRQAEGIFLYTGGNGDGGIHDTNGNGGYTYVKLPWNDGDVKSNLPNNFCKNITPEKGWELAINRCGSRNITNGNFFALYNKWTGVLRFFYYQPDGFNTGNDHVWQVSMSNNLADKKMWGYGLPSNENVNDRSKLSSVDAGTQVDYVTPWVEMRSGDGQIAPNTGWWAFDVNLSLYRPKDDLSQDTIRLQMRSWNDSHVSLCSAMKAQKEEEAFGAWASSISQGVCTAVAGGQKIASGAAALYKGNFADGLGALADAFGLGSEFAGLFGGGEAPLDANMHLGLNGTIDTDEYIKGSAPTAGIASPTFLLKDFDLQNSHVGQGVWNIKKHPVVDVFNSFVSLYPGEGCSWFQPYFFDPSSIEVELNPNVFPESEVEWMQVDATCVTTKDMGLNGTDKYREALGLESLHEFSKFRIYEDPYIGNEIGVSDKDVSVKEYWYNNDSHCPYSQCDYFCYSEDKEIMEFPVKIWEEQPVPYYPLNSIIGRGVKGKFVIEPLLLDRTSMRRHVENNIEGNVVPSLMVNVVVSVKMKGMAEPIQFSRNYLPEIKYFHAGQLDEIYSNITNHKVNPKQVGHTKSYDYQVKRIGKLIETWKPWVFDYSAGDQYHKK